MSTKLRFLDDVKNKTLDGIPYYLKKLASLRQFIQKFNQQGSTEESHSRALVPISRRKRAATQCLDSTVRLLDGPSYRGELLRRLRLSPEQVSKLVDRLKIFGDLHSRDLLDDQQSETNSKQIRARSALSKIQKLIPIFLDEARTWADTVDGVFDMVPEHLRDLDIVGKSWMGLFSQPQELVTMISTSFGLLVSVSFNIYSLVTTLRLRQMRKTEEKLGVQQKKDYPSPKSYPVEEFQPLMPSAPSPVRYQPALQQMMTMPSYQPRMTRDQLAHMALMMKQQQ
jgi:hypothetical protein